MATPASHNHHDAFDQPQFPPHLNRANTYATESAYPSSQQRQVDAHDEQELRELRELKDLLKLRELKEALEEKESRQQQPLRKPNRVRRDSAFHDIDDWDVRPPLPRRTTYTDRYGGYN
jgi:hypothetical protein